MNDKALCPDTIRACIEALPPVVGPWNRWLGPIDPPEQYWTVYSDPRKALESLLPPPDHAKELYQRWQKEGWQKWNEGDPNISEDEGAIRWLISNNIIDTSKLGGE